HSDGPIPALHISMTSVLAHRLRAFLAHDVLRFAMLVAAAAFLLDWATKSWALDTLEHAAVPLGALMLGVERNEALAFSAGAGTLPPWIVIGIRLLAIAGVLALSIQVGARNRRLAAGFALLLAGGSGNAADMLFRGGAVVDFIHAGPFHLRGELVHAGIVFNAADIAILLALGLLAPLIQEWSTGSQRRIADWEGRWLQRLRGER
ncbi:MAG: signal peptidase II, partial [Gemmatimonadetes bacterium]|nr:signal peptidase II [Gemmatimonadota bacterium]